VLPTPGTGFLVAERRTATHLRLDVYPDGGLTRLRCYGELPPEVRLELYERFCDVLPAEHQEFQANEASDSRHAPPADHTSG
jgi:allantoicase